MRTILDEDRDYLELASWREDKSLLEAVAECVGAQRALAADRSASSFEPDSSGGEVVSTRMLREILATGRDIHGIANHREISNVVVFNARHIKGSLMSRRVAESRRRVDRLIAQKVREHFGQSDLMVNNSGHFWYPPGGYMSWHTNSGDPGWRLYVTFAEEPGKSFFRYRDPQDGEIVTSLDKMWDFRLFKVSRDRHFWHAVYSDTHRFSLGFIIRPWSLRGFASMRLRRTRKSLGF